MFSDELQGQNEGYTRGFIAFLGLVGTASA